MSSAVPWTNSRPSTSSTSWARTTSRRTASSPGPGPLAGANEKWHIHGGNDQLISGLLDRVPAGASIWIRSWWPCGPRAAAATSAPSRVARPPRTSPPTMSCWPCPSPPCAWSTSAVCRHLAPCTCGPSRRSRSGATPSSSLSSPPGYGMPSTHSGNAYCDGVVQGAWDPTIYQAGPAGILAALPGGDDRPRLGARYGLTTYVGSAAGRHGAGLSRRI